jgi:hypothetical protein
MAWLLLGMKWLCSEFSVAITVPVKNSVLLEGKIGSADKTVNYN